MTAAAGGQDAAGRRTLRELRDTGGWRVRYRYTATERRRVQFVAPDGTLWEAVRPARATHIRRHQAGLAPTYLRRVPA